MKVLALTEGSGNGVKRDKIKEVKYISHLVDLLWEKNDSEVFVLKHCFLRFQSPKCAVL